MFIRDIFIPEKIGSYFIFGKRVAAFEITRTNVYVSVVYRKAHSIIIEKCIDIPLNHGASADYNERVIEALKKAAAQIPKSATIYTSIPSSQALLKELKLPFLGRDKIAMVINYEVEPLLPFSLADAVIDFIVTKESVEEKSSEVLVIAVQKNYIAQHLNLFQSAGLYPEKVSVDVLGLYSIFLQTPTYARQKGGVVLLEIEQQQTRIAYLNDGILRSVRTIPKGLQDLAHAISKKIMIEPQAISDHLARVGLQQEENSEHPKIYQEVFSTFINDIALTLQAFTAQTQPPQVLSQLILFGQCTNIKGLTELLSDILAIPCSKWDVQEFIRTQSIVIKNKMGTISQQHLVSVGIALPAPTIESFDLRKNEFALNARRELFVALGITGFLSLALLCVLAICCFIKVNHIRYQVKEAEQETIDALRDRFKKIPEDATALDEVVDEAQKEVDREEKVWLAFSGYGRDTILRYLLELTTIIDKQSLGLVMERLTIAEDTITLKASVRGFEELKALVRDLRQSKLFNYVEPQNDTRFTMVIRLKKQMGG